MVLALEVVSLVSGELLELSSMDIFWAVILFLHWCFVDSDASWGSLELRRTVFDA